MPKGKPKFPTDPETGRKIITESLGEIQHEVCGTGITQGDQVNIDLAGAIKVMQEWLTLKHKGKVPYRRLWLNWFQEWEHTDLELMGERLETDEEFEARQNKTSARKKQAKQRDLAKARELLEKHGIEVPDEAKEQADVSKE